MDISDIVASSMHDAEDGITPEPEVSSEPEVQAEPVVEAAAPAPAAEPTATVDELAKELEQHGLKAPIEGQRENRIPYSKVKKIVENAKRKATEALQKEVEGYKGKLTAAEQQQQQIDKVNNLIRTDPERYLQILAAMHPQQYRRFLQQIGQNPNQPQPQAPTKDPFAEMPSPDAKFPDGSEGYSPEGLKKLLAWQNQQVENRVLSQVREENTKRYGKIEQDYRAHELRQQQIPVVTAQFEAARASWGPLFDEHQGDILKALERNLAASNMGTEPLRSLESITASVLAPKMQEKMAALQPKRDEMRADILKEMNKRPVAASRSAPVAGIDKAEGGGGKQSIEDIVRESMARLK